MTDPLTPDRFRALAEAYGGAVARWPAAVQAEATRLAAEPWAQAVLRDADALDAVLDRWTVPAPDAALRAAVAQATPAARRRPLRLWWTGLGLVAALSGAAAGTVAAAAVAPADPPTEGATAFGDLSGQEG